MAVMNKLLTLALSFPLVACVVGSDTATGGDDGTGSGNGSGSGSGSGSGGGGNGHITSNTMWTGTVDVAKDTVVDSGVTLTIAPGTTVRFASGVAISAAGIVDIQGTKASPVHLSPSVAGGHFGGITVPANGEVKMAYGVQAGGGVSVYGGKLTVTDSLMSQASGDFLVVSAGTVNVSYSAIGLEPGAGTDTTHCDMHFGGTATTIHVTHSNISTSSYGIMLYGGSGVDLTYNNWFANSDADVDTSGAAGGTSGDISNGWFQKAPGPFPGATVTAKNLAAARLTDAGPR
jgi:hypothetical protein